jgi:hypothetical protein
MTYALLSDSLRETADHARKYFASDYGARKFLCEQEFEKGLSLRPTWQAETGNGYPLCIEVLERLRLSNTLYQFVNQCASRGIPVRLWVVLPKTGDKSPSFSKEIRAAKELGVGVAHFDENGLPYEFHKPVPLSLFALRKTDLRCVPRGRREQLKGAEDEFLAGAPDQGCQKICQELESITRKFAEHTFERAWWKSKKTRALKPRFFRIDSWARMLEELDAQIDQNKVSSYAATFTKTLIAGARQFTNWRNAVSHKPRNSKELQERDAKLRTMFEATRDLLLEWYEVAKRLKLMG